MIKVLDMLTGEEVEIPLQGERRVALMWKVEEGKSERAKLERLAIPVSILIRNALNMSVLFMTISSFGVIGPLFVIGVLRNSELVFRIMDVAGMLTLIDTLVTVVLMVAKRLWCQKCQKAGITIPTEFEL